MIRVSVRRDLAGRIRALRGAGHARFDHEGGVDLVCAGVSSLLGAVAIGLTEVVRAPVRLHGDDGRFEVEIPARMAPEQSLGVQVLLETAVKALEALEASYRGSVRVRHLRPRG